MRPGSDTPKSLSLEQLLRRDDVWRGRVRRLATRPVVDTGHGELNAELLQGGWPLGALIEVCQPRFQGEWQLFLPALLAIHPGLILLLNPPAEPFSQALIQAGVDLDRLVVVKAAKKSLFIPSFTELARTAACGAMLAWQPEEPLGYTDLRKCLLAASEGAGLYAVFRPSAARRQSSPAPLRLLSQRVAAGLAITLFKQKGLLRQTQPKPLILPLPAPWRALPGHAALDGAAPGAGSDRAGKILAHPRGRP
ncbi:MAG: diguanylate cyclase [Pseudomonadota bacterium]|nr:diguanylate cyclase [Pseudomonadota bacterium]